MDWYMNAIEAGSPWSFLLLFGQVVLLSMLLERSVFLLFKARVNVTLFLGMLKKLASTGTMDRAIKLTQAVDAPIGRVCRAGLQGLGKGPFLLSDDLDRAIAAELPAIHRRIATIPLLAAAVAAVGVLGSVSLGAGTPNFGGDGPLPLGLGQEHALALVGVASGLLAGIWGLALRSKAQDIATGLARGKAFVLDLDGDANVGAFQQGRPAG